MPLLRFHSPPISFEQRKIMGEELTVILAELTGQSPDRILIHFCPYETDQLACEGRLIQETESPVYILELLGLSASAGFRELLGQRLLEQLLDLLGLTVQEQQKIHIYYLDTQPLPIAATRPSDTIRDEMAGQTPRPRPVIIGE